MGNIEQAVITPLPPAVFIDPDVSRETMPVKQPHKLWRNEYEVREPFFFVDEVEFDGWVMPGVHLGRGEWRTAEIAEQKAADLLDVRNTAPCQFCGGHHDRGEMTWRRAVEA